MRLISYGATMRPRTTGWVWAIAGLTILLIILSFLVKSNPESAFDRTSGDWIRGREVPGMAAYFSKVSAITDLLPRLAIAAGLVLALFASGRRRDAAAATLIAIVVGSVGLVFDSTLGEFVGRGRPLPELTGPGFPSGPTYGRTLLFGFTGFLLYRTSLRRKVVWFLLAALTLLIISVGVSRVFLSAHWPSDVVGGYLLGLALLTLMIRMYGLRERSLWTLRKSNPRPAD